MRHQVRAGLGRIGATEYGVRGSATAIEPYGRGLTGTACLAPPTRRPTVRWCDGGHRVGSAEWPEGP